MYKVNKPAVAAVVAQKDGTFTVLRCTARADEPAEFRQIERRFPGFSCYGKALERAELMESNREK